LSRRFAGERDFVAQFLLPRLKEAAGVLGVSDVVDFAVEKPVDGYADLAAERAGKRLFVIEAKFKKRVGRVERDIEPRDPDVIGQAANYAVLGGYPFYATCNVKRLVLFRFRPGVKAFESEVASFEYARASDWAESLLKVALGLVPLRLKPLDDSLVDTLHEAFNDLYPEFLGSLRGKLQERRFRDRYVEWLERQGLEPSDETARLVAAQATYMEINKFLFYHVIRIIYPERLEPLRIEEHEDVAGALSRFYDAVRAIDYAPIYEKSLIGEIPFTRRAEERVRTLLDTLGDFDFSRMESDFIGRIYEKLIPAEERKRLGQFYTPPGIVDFIVRLTVRDPDAAVLDPGCGSGSFLVRAYHRLRGLKGYPSDARGMLAYAYHQELLDQLYGVDINPFPAHLSVINLAVQNPRARIKAVNVLVEDFFNIKPGVTTLTGFKSFTAEGDRSLVTLPPFFDAIVANPPYIRQELLGASEKKLIKELIENEYRNKLFIGSTARKPKNAITLNKQSDIYIYFFIHGLKLLKDGGYLGFISSNKWLEVAYGEPFQRFLLENAKILYIVEFDRAIFPDAEVNTAITILQKENTELRRKENLTKFIRVKKKIPIEVLAKTIQEVNDDVEKDIIRINLIKQDKLTIGKWNVYLRAPPVYKQIVENPKVNSLSNYAKVLRAPTTGHNDYFILNKEKANEWQIEKNYLKPCLTSPKEVKGLEVKKTDNFMFVVHENKQKLKGTNALKYIEFGERLEVEVRRGSKKGKKKLPELETLKPRKPFWYALPKRDAPQILFPRLIDVRPVFLKNNIKAHTPHVFYYIYPNNKKDTDLLLAYLNSSVTALLIELYGRSYGGGVLELLVYEAQNLPTIDPESLSNQEKDRIIQEYNNLIKAVNNTIQAEKELELMRSKSPNSIGLFEKEAQEKLSKSIEYELKIRHNLDEAIYDALGLTAEERRQVEEGLRELQEIRRLRTKT